MAHIYERVVSLISKPPDKRHERDIDLLISWFQNMSGLFKSQKTDVVKDIVRNCKFLSVPEDTVIIRQGDQGDSFFIILTGLVSIYINQQLEEQGNLTKSTPLRQRKARSGNHSRRSANRKDGENKQAAHNGHGGGSTSTVHNGDGGGSTSTDSRESVESESGHTRDSGISEISNDDVTLSTESSSDSDSESAFGSINNFKPNSEKLDRKQFGVHIRELGAGKSFGELALVQADNVRSASILSDLSTDLIVVNRDLYNRCLKTAQEMQFKEKKDFVASCSLFSNWTPRQRKIMAMSFTKTRYDYGNTIVKQGEPVRGIFFVLNGNVKLSVDPLHHVKQYPLYSSEKELSVANALRSGKMSHDRKLRDVNNNNLRLAGPSAARRRGGYAEAEKLATRKFVDICTVGPSESIGDFEVILRLPTYLQTVRCQGPVDVFELDLNNFERQLVKRSPKTFSNMRELAQTKLTSRMQRLHDKQVYTPVMEKMLEKIEEINLSHKKGPKQKAEDDSVLFNQGWHKYRQRQRQFLRRRERERRLQEMKRMQMQYAALGGDWHRMRNTHLQPNFPQQPLPQQQPLDRLKVDVVGLRGRSFSDSAMLDLTPTPILPEIPHTTEVSPNSSENNSILESTPIVEIVVDDRDNHSSQSATKPRSSSISNNPTLLPKLQTMRPRTASEV
ncbi:uncharacterized protein [Antedon mediterranea]|uniref:uncharacterized protein n=1 Tax=Antedon mediterranea TaxID=105859 RepID=UPI003AF7C43D